LSVAFLITSLIIVATPGTGALISLSAGLSRGPRASVVAAFGCTLGIVPHLEDDQPARSPARVIGSAVLANALNPKLTIFFFAFLPQFVPPHAHHELARLLLLSGIFMAMTFIVFVIYGVGAAAVRRHVIDRPLVVQRVRQVFAASFVGLGVKLATTSR
jgi:threonine/homoserine/homoserine lactone efflux protein